MLRKGMRTVAIVLIALPEPVTTVLGILILCATFVIFRQASLKNFGNLEGLANKSLQNPEPPVGFRRYLVVESPVVNHVIKPNLSSQPDKIPGKSEITSTVSQYHSWFDNRKVSEKTLHHTLKTSFPQYEAVPELAQNSNLKAIIMKNNEPAVEHHKLKSSLIPDTTGGLPQPRPNKCVALRTGPVVHHMLKIG